MIPVGATLLSYPVKSVLKLTSSLQSFNLPYVLVFKYTESHMAAFVSTVKSDKSISPPLLKTISGLARAVFMPGSE